MKILFTKETLLYIQMPMRAKDPDPPSSELANVQCKQHHAYIRGSNQAPSMGSPWSNEFCMTAS
jgi:hypothetical protein